MCVFNRPYFCFDHRIGYIRIFLDRYIQRTVRSERHTVNVVFLNIGLCVYRFGGAFALFHSENIICIVEIEILVVRGQKTERFYPEVSGIFFYTPFCRAFIYFSLVSVLCVSRDYREFSLAVKASVNIIIIAVIAVNSGSDLVPPHIIEACIVGFFTEDPLYVIFVAVGGKKRVALEKVIVICPSEVVIDRVVVGNVNVVILAADLYHRPRVARDRAADIAASDADARKQVIISHCIAFADCLIVDQRSVGVVYPHFFVKIGIGVANRSVIKRVLGILSQHIVNISRFCYFVPRAVNTRKDFFGSFVKTLDSGRYFRLVKGILRLDPHDGTSVSRRYVDNIGKNIKDIGVFAYRAVKDIAHILAVQLISSQVDAVAELTELRSDISSRLGVQSVDLRRRISSQKSVLGVLVGELGFLGVSRKRS